MSIANKIKGTLLVGLLRLIYALPLTFTKALGRFFGKLMFTLSKKSRNIILTNLSIAFPELDNTSIKKLGQQSATENGQLLAEFPLAWYGNENQIRSQFVSECRCDLIDAIKAKNEPLIMAVPHIGNWEFFWHWLQFKYPTIGMYSPAKIPRMDEVTLNARNKFNGQVFPTDSRGIMSLFKGLKSGKVLMILPDQTPKKGAGIYAPFFSHSAYTMTLLHKLISKTNANLLFGSCFRLDGKKGFQIEIEAPVFNSREPDVEIFNRDMNKQLENIIDKHPPQYQWEYKRYKRQEDGRDIYLRK